MKELNLNKLWFMHKIILKRSVMTKYAMHNKHMQEIMHYDLCCFENKLEKLNSE